MKLRRQASPLAGRSVPVLLPGRQPFTVVGGSKQLYGRRNTHAERKTTMNMLSRLAPMLAALALILSPLGVSKAAAQAADATVPTADARDFLGNWRLAIQSDMGPFELGLNVKDNSGRLAADITAALAGAPSTSPVDRITKSESSLVVHYATDFQGTPLPIVITLTPDQGAIKVSLSAAEGMFTAAGTATKQQ
jgi:hypothetical protein